MNREQRLRAAGMDEPAAATLASLPAATVDEIAAAVRAAHRAGREHEKAMRRRHRGRPRDVDELARAAERTTVSGLGRRAADDLEALAALADHYAGANRVMGLAVDGLRARGYTDQAIADRLGVTRAAIGARYGPRRDMAPTQPGV